MASNKLSGAGKRLASPGRGQNRWDMDQRETIHVLYTQFEMSAAKKLDVFNTIFADHLRACGLASGLSQRSFTAQYGERKKSPPQKDWEVILTESRSPAQKARRREIIKWITQIAAPSNHLPPAHAGPIAPPSTGASKQTQWPSAAATAAIGVDSAFTERERKRTHRARTEGIVVISQAERCAAAAAASLTITDLSTPNMTPKGSKTSRNRRLAATVSYQLPSGSEIWLTPAEYRETQAELVIVNEATAHPDVSLLFRYWDDNCQSKLTDRGFTAGLFATTIIEPPPPPTAQNFPWANAAVHLNRDRVASPFISTSNNFIWVLRLALKEAQRGASNGHITLIDPRKLNKLSAFHAQPIHCALRKKRPFDKGAFLFSGLHEFLVWARVPVQAVISTISIAKLFEFADRDRRVGAILRLDQLGAARTGYTTTILPALREENIMALAPASITAMAQVCTALRLNASLVEAVSCLVSDLVYGLGLRLAYKDSEDWRSAAAFFAQTMTTGRATFVDCQNLQYAFLDGCRYACGDPNVRQKPDRMKTMLTRANNMGLGSPAEILTLQLDAAKSSIMQYHRKQQRLLQGKASSALLAEADEVEDSIMVDPNADGDEMMSDRDIEDDEILYDVDEDARSVYEL